MDTTAPTQQSYDRRHHPREGPLRVLAFDVTVTGVRRHPPDGPVPSFAARYAADRLLDCVADAGYLNHQPPAGLLPGRR
jgi:hypothetical protein